MKSWDIKFLVKPLLHKQQKMSRKWQLLTSIFLKAITWIQYNFKFECRLGPIFICWYSFACNILSQNHLNSVPEHRDVWLGLLQASALKKPVAKTQLVQKHLKYLRKIENFRSKFGKIVSLVLILLLASCVSLIQLWIILHFKDLPRIFKSGANNARTPLEEFC